MLQILKELLSGEAEGSGTKGDLQEIQGYPNASKSREGIFGTEGKRSLLAHYLTIRAGIQKTTPETGNETAERKKECAVKRTKTAVRNIYTTTGYVKWYACTFASCQTLPVRKVCLKDKAVLDRTKKHASKIIHV